MKTLLAASAAILISGAASAATIWDESVSGDLATSGTPTALGTISDGSIFGSLDAGVRSGPIGPDESDIFTFTLTETIALSITTSNEVAEVPGFVMFGENIFTNINVPEFLRAGEYLFSFVPTGNEGSFDYEITFGNPSPVPLPAGGLLLLSGLAGCGILARRKKTMA